MKYNILERTFRQAHIDIRPVQNIVFYDYIGDDDNEAELFSMVPNSYIGKHICFFF